LQNAIDKYMAMEPKIPDWKKLQHRAAKPAP
jgi:hypothetical protein